MRRLRIVAAAVSVLTALVDWLLALNPDVPAGAIALAALSAVCLAAFTPFDALAPRRRKLAFAACLMFLLGIVGAFVLAAGASPGGAPLASLAALAAIGLVLSVWSFAIRNRRRRTGWRNYYDN